MSETRYKYIAIDAIGKKRQGQINATSEQKAYRQLAAQGLTPTRISQAGASVSLFTRDAIKPADVAAFTRELSVLVEAKIPLGRGLQSIAEHEDRPRHREMIRDLASMIEAGSRITDALTKYKDVFGEVYIETMRAAEKTGNLAEVTHHLADMLEKQIESGQQLKRALSYPIIVMVFVALAMTIIVVFVVPRFGKIFEANGVDLPVTTRIVQAIGDSVKAAWWGYAAMLAGIIGGSVAMWKSPAGRDIFERLMLRIPHIGKIIVATTAARFSRVLSICLGSGLDLMEAVEIGGRATGRPLFVRECDHMADRLRSGDRLAEVIQSSNYLPGFATRMLGAGKDARELASASSVIARHYDRESEHLSKNINTLIEPLMTIAMAGIVLLVALSVFLPMWQMIKVNH
ncbi:MAG: type II secretion system F family protein [Phycisphaerales bacterium JB059]